MCNEFVGVERVHWANGPSDIIRERRRQCCSAAVLQLVVFVPAHSHIVALDKGDQ